MDECEIWKKIFIKQYIFFSISGIFISLIYNLVSYKKYFLAWELELKRVLKGLKRMLIKILLLKYFNFELKLIDNW